MQTSNQISISSKSILTNSNRHLVRHQIKSCLENLNVQIQELCSRSSSLNLKNIETEANILINNLIDNLEIESNKKKLASTFYENRYGFSDDELKHSQYQDFNSLNKSPLNMNALFNSNNKLLNSSFNYQQVRGFKTKRQMREDNRESSFADMLRG